MLALGSAAFNSRGIYRWELQSSEGVPGSNWDLLTLSESLTVGATPSDPFVIAVTPLSPGAFDGGVAHSWPIVSAETISGFDPDAFRIDASALEGFGLAGSAFSVSSRDGQLILNYSPVPEPACVAALSAMSVLAWRRRRPKWTA
jgi:hypothetical protein